MGVVVVDGDLVKVRSNRNCNVHGHPPHQPPRLSPGAIRREAIGAPHVGVGRLQHIAQLGIRCLVLRPTPSFRSRVIGRKDCRDVCPCETLGTTGPPTPRSMGLAPSPAAPRTRRTVRRGGSPFHDASVAYLSTVRDAGRRGQLSRSISRWDNSRPQSYPECS